MELLIPALIGALIGANAVLTFYVIRFRKMQQEYLKAVHNA